MNTSKRSSAATSPKLRFKGFTNNWEEKELNEILQVSNLRNSNNKYSREEVLSVSGELGIVNQVKHLGRSYAGIKLDNYHIVEVGDIVYTKSPLKNNPYGIIKTNKHTAGIVSTLYAVYKVREGYNSIFIERYFELDDRTNRYLRPLVHKGAKNDMKISNERVLIDPINVPSLPEQKKISSFLDLVDNWIDKLRHQKSLLEFYKKGLVQKVFSQQVRIKDNHGEDFSAWREMTLGSLLDYEQPSNYIVKSVEYNNRYKIPVLTAGKTFILGYTDETDDIFEKEKLPVIIFDDFTTAQKFVDFPFKVKSSAMKILLNKNTSVSDIRYVYLAMQKIKFSLGDEHKRFWISEYSKIKIPVPSLTEQQKIANYFSSIDKLLDIKQHYISQAEKWKKSLLQHLFV